jgi:cytochrome c
MHTARRTLIVATLLATTLAAPAALAQERGTKDEAKALNDAAVTHIKKVGVDQAAKDFADKSRWMVKDLYPFVMDFGGVMRYHLNDKMIGKVMLDVKDASGKEFGKEMLSIAKAKGNGWVDYEWSHPVSKKIEDKTAFIQRVPGADLFVGVGIYR